MFFILFYFWKHLRGWSNLANSRILNDTPRMVKLAWKMIWVQIQWIRQTKKIALTLRPLWRHDTKHNDTQHSDIHHNDTHTWSALKFYDNLTIKTTPIVEIILRNSYDMFFLFQACSACTSMASTSTATSTTPRRASASGSSGGLSTSQPGVDAIKLFFRVWKNKLERLSIFFSLVQYL